MTLYPLSVFSKCYIKMIYLTAVSHFTFLSTTTPSWDVQYFVFSPLSITTKLCCHASSGPFFHSCLIPPARPSAARSGRSWGGSGSPCHLIRVNTCPADPHSKTDQQHWAAMTNFLEERPFGSRYTNVYLSIFALFCFKLFVKISLNILTHFYVVKGNRKEAARIAAEFYDFGQGHSKWSEYVWDMCRGVWDSSGEDDMPYYKPSYSSCRCVWVCTSVINNCSCL